MELNVIKPFSIERRVFSTLLKMDFENNDKILLQEATNLPGDNEDYWLIQKNNIDCSDDYGHLISYDEICKYTDFLDERRRLIFTVSSISIQNEESLRKALSSVLPWFVVNQNHIHTLWIDIDGKWMRRKVSPYGDGHYYQRDASLIRAVFMERIDRQEKVEQFTEMEMLRMIADTIP